MSYIFSGAKISYTLNYRNTVSPINEHFRFYINCVRSNTPKRQKEGKNPSF